MAGDVTTATSGLSVQRVGLTGCGPFPVSVVAASQAVSVGELVDGALCSGADRAAGLPLGRLLLGADAELQVAELARGRAHGAGAVGGAGALGAGRAGSVR